jgi:hypothetical protein
LRCGWKSLQSATRNPKKINQLSQNQAIWLLIDTKMTFSLAESHAFF